MSFKGGRGQGFDMSGFHVTDTEFAPSLAEGFPVRLHFLLSPSRDKSEGMVISHSIPE